MPKDMAKRLPPRKLSRQPSPTRRNGVGRDPSDRKPPAVRTTLNDSTRTEETGSMTNSSLSSPLKRSGSLGSSSTISDQQGAEKVVSFCLL
jgi:hypothetical protein